jgi:hypothetical protein
MPVLEWSAVNAVPPLIAVAALVVTLSLRVRSALRTRAAVRRMRAAGRIPIRDERAHVIQSNATLRRELLRVLKHLVINAAVILPFLAMTHTAEYRNYDLAVISLLMLTNSLLDERVEQLLGRH